MLDVTVGVVRGVRWHWLAMSICEDMVGFGAVEKRRWKPREGYGGSVGT